MAPPIGVSTAQRRAQFQYLFTDTVNVLFSVSLGRALYTAVREATEAVDGQLIAVAEAFRRGIAPGPRIDMFHDLGVVAQRSVLNSYDQTRSKGGPAGYRRTANNPRNVRYAGGVLRRALGDPSFFEAYADGLRFINIDLLDKRARQWARLNFGAAPRGAGSTQRFPVRLGLVSFALGLDEGPRGEFVIPAGYWRGGEFYPIGEGPEQRRDLRPGRQGRSQTRLAELTSYQQLRGREGVRLQRRRPTAGVVARHFLDAGVRRIATEFPTRLDRLYDRFFDDIKVRQTIQRHVSFPLPTPRVA